VKRRTFIAGLGSAAAWPVAARAQQPAMPLVGYLHGTSAEPPEDLLAAFRRGLSEMGYIDGRNVTISIHAAEQNNRLRGPVAELLARHVAVLFATTLGAAAVAKAATATIPIVFSGAGDPVRLGLVATLNRPGGNATGMASLSVELESKRLELLRELVPSAAVIGFLRNPATLPSNESIADLESVARSLGQQIVFLNASTAAEIDAAFATAMRQRVNALLVATSAFFRSQRNQIVALAASHAIPASYYDREFVVAGGLMSYGQNTPERVHQAAIYVGRILKGEKPADLPVQQPTRFEFVLNLTTAKALGLPVPSSILIRTDEVIE
jgi:putative tryptophan/tyrosine transport system substrate-binding protein